MNWLNRRSRIQEIIAALGTERPSCVNCGYFIHSSEVCGLDPLRRRPPARVIADGCPSFDEDVPF